MRKRSIVIIALVWMVVLVAGVSSAITMAVCGRMPGNGSGGKEDGRSERYARLEEVRLRMEEQYVEKPDEEALMLGAVRGMLASVEDPYTFYYTREEMDALSRRSLGLYDGVGLLVSADKAGHVRVLRVFAGSPAYEAGVRVGDRITAVNGHPVSGKSQQTLDEAVERMKSSPAQLLKLEILRGEELLTLGMVCSTIQMERVEYRMLENKVGYLAIYEFIGDDVEAFRSGMQALKRQGADKVIIDLRSNPGGMLEDVVQIADSLMGEGMIAYTQDRYGNRSEYFSAASRWDVEIAVLVNGMTASASEILAGALQDTGTAIVVGEQTFGKGVVQTVYTFPEDGAGMQLTTARYYTPSGRSIHGVGIQPDIKVSLDAEHEILSGEADLLSDSQLYAAYEALLQKNK